MDNSRPIPARSPTYWGLTIEELESRLEQACIQVDPCFGSYCWQFADGYGGSQDCSMHCAPFYGCHPYCYE